MNFELDCDYFNRAGDKVRYVGMKPHTPMLLFRGDDAQAFEIWPHNGMRFGHLESALDILGKWEIADDPERVYVVCGKEYRYGDTILRYDQRTFAIVPESTDVALVEKILIKPLDLKQGKVEMPTFDFKKEMARANKEANKLMRKCIDEVLHGISHLDKIEPLNLELGCSTLIERKINELIAAHNAKLDK